MILINNQNIKAVAFKFVILLGVVSFLSDATFEGAKSITGAYFATLGANALTVGFIAGFGELVSYTIRLLSGYISDKTKWYWLLTLFGYGCNIIAIPLLAFVTSWKIAAALIILERFGKAIRTPPRDSMLSYAGHNLGMGYGFGLHQMLDQFGAMAGPLLIAGILFFHGGYRESFAWLFFPALATMIILFYARKLFPKPQDLEFDSPEEYEKEIPKVFWIYLIASCFVAAGYADFPLIAYHFQTTHILSPALIPFSYAIAMSISALTAIILGYLYDKRGANILNFAIVISAFFAPLVFLGNSYWIVFGMILWGIGYGAQNSVLKAIIGNLVGKKRRGTAYGIFNTVYGISWFLGSVLMGFLYSISFAWMIGFSVVAQLIFVPLFIFGQKINKIS